MQAANDTSRYPAAQLSAAVDAMFRAAGMQENIAAAVTASLVDADMMGHSTHGVALVPWYLEGIKNGWVTLAGEPEVIADHGACITWNGRKLPGAWLLSEAIDIAIDRVQQLGVVTIVMANSYHTGALAVYMPKLTERGLMAVLACSAPPTRGIAPYGGTKGLLSPNPLAAGIPTDGDPILLDISSSITTMNSTRQLHARGEKYPAMWAIDAQGNPTDDPQVVMSGGGTLLPTGGLDHGHKGYSMALLIEALTQGLPGYGRMDNPGGILMGVYLQVIDPNAFAGIDAYKRQTSWLVEQCHSNPPRPGVDRVRVPGEQALKKKREAVQQGVPVGASAFKALAAAAAILGVGLPAPL
ncbi:Ldh family oxidoreductase [Lacisediminimonas profundi]|uniref:Ldh family oxidoreductase n=1 Tax=Lacisediminimonas profundi TaxID=2603856 RepID=UPI00124B0800|nr:Ldh family oxidoreductase [Lacisediminimonas profundi]